MSERLGGAELPAGAKAQQAIITSDICISLMYKKAHTCMSFTYLMNISIFIPWFHCLWLFFIEEIGFAPTERKLFFKNIYVVDSDLLCTIIPLIYSHFFVPAFNN